MPRKYTKRDKEYWNSISKTEASLPQPAPRAEYAKPGFVGFSTETKARSADTSSRTSRRRNESSKGLLDDRYSIIRQGMLPYEHSSDHIDVRDAIKLCQKAYANISLFRNVVDMMAEFSNNELYLEGGTKQSRQFFKAWLKRIGAWNLTDQYFREYFRGGNVFLWRIDGKFSDEDFRSILRSQAAKNNIVPVKYILLNPFEIVAKHAGYYENGVYEKVLSQYDLKRLANPITDEDKKIFKSLPPETQKKIKSKQWTADGLYMPLDPNKLYFSFYKKQDYEPFAIPFGFPVLGDLNMKQEFKNIDAAIMRTVENVILLITNGDEPDKGGINPQTVKDLQELFQNESSGRVLVADYTTKADFVIPDLNKVMGKEKYEVLNQDIKDGLQNIMLSNDSHSTADIKVKVFLDRLKEARSQFLMDFLQKEIDRISADLGFKKAPTAKFKDIDMKDDIQLMRIGTRLMELSILTPEQGMDFLKRGELPNGEEFDEAQKEYLAKRKKGYYNPMVGGVPTIAPPADPNAAKKNMTPASKGRPMGAKEQPSSKTTVKKMAASAASINSFYSYSDDKLSDMFGENINEEQENVMMELCNNIIASKSEAEWRSVLDDCLEDFSKADELSVKPDIIELATVHNLSLSAASVLYHSL